MVEFVYRDGWLEGAGLKLRAACGAAGVTAHKQEGDGATPAGLHPLLRVLYRADRVKAPRCAVALEPIGPQDAWCDDAAHPAYNKPILLPHEARHEALWLPTPIYDIIGVLGWNTHPVVPGRGSAIFLHVATQNYGPSAGCITLSLADLGAALARNLSAILVS